MKKDRHCHLLYLIFLSALIAVAPALASAEDSSLHSLAHETAGRDAAARKKMMLDYSIFINSKNDVPLRDFREGASAASRALGGKAALVLHLLRQVAGEEAFSRAAGEFPAAPPGAWQWHEIQKAFEKETGKDLGWFFRQWVDRKGLPDLRADNTSVRRNGSRFEVSFDLIQKGEVYTLEIPVFISFIRGGGKADRVMLDTGEKRVTLLLDDEPAAVEIDGEYDIPRIPTAEETPPLLAGLLNEEKPYLVLPESGADVYAGVIKAWKERGAALAAPGIGDEIRTSALIVLGADNPLIARLYGRAGRETGELRLVARKNPWAPGKVVVMVEATSVRAADQTMRELADSGDCSALTVDDQGRVTQKTGESERGIRMDLREEPAAVDASAVKTLSQVIEATSGKKIVYVGEFHDRFSHHEVQLRVIQGMYRKDPRIAIGMEMFQRPFQAVLDEYIAGSIDEREFLKKSEYFKRWSFDYNLYKPILDFARASKIPVVALNIRNEIVDKVSKGGMASLTAEERKEIPAQTDFSDADYRERLRGVFARHTGEKERTFDFFYQAQVLWDETMAMSVDEYLRKNPDRRMAVIAGAGHLAYGSGIPRRAFRRNGYEYAVILNDADTERDIADYLVYPAELEGVTAPKLMAILKDGGGKVVIVELPNDSVSRKAGLKTGDTIVAMDGGPVQSVADVKIALFYKKAGDELKVTAMRRRFLLGEKPVEFVVKLR